MLKQKLSKKLYIALILALTLAFATKTLASLTFTDNAITGTSSSTIDVGSGNTLSLQAVNNGNIITGTGNVGIANSSPGELLALGTSGTTKGVVSLSGNTSGKVIIQPAAAAGSWTLTLPTSTGTNGQVLTTNGSGVTSWTTVSGGSGDVVGPGSATDNAIARFDSTTGKLIQNSSATIDDSGNITAPGVITSGSINTTRPYKVYTALLSQTGSDAPTARVLENTLGGTVVWTRSDPGEYVATLAGAFPGNKFFSLRQSGYISSPAAENITFHIEQINDDSFTVQSQNGDTGAGEDWWLAEFSLEIRVYP